MLDAIGIFNDTIAKVVPVGESVTLSMLDVIYTP